MLSSLCQYLRKVTLSRVIIGGDQLAGCGGEGIGQNDSSWAKAGGMLCLILSVILELAED